MAATPSPPESLEKLPRNRDFSVALSGRLQVSTRLRPGEVHCRASAFVSKKFGSQACGEVIRLAALSVDGSARGRSGESLHLPLGRMKLGSIAGPL